MHDDLEQRKSQHLDLVQRHEVEPEGTDTLLSCVRLVHRALPELRLDEVDVSAELCGVRLRAPLMIVGMTGGTERAGRINQKLAQQWISRPNSNLMFHNEPPLRVLTRGGVPGMISVRRLLDSRRGGR